MRRYIPILLSLPFALLFFTCRVEENVEPTNVQGYVKLIGESVESPTIAVDMKHHPDGGFVLLASAETIEGTESKFRPKLLQIDNNGYVVWSNTFTAEISDYRSNSVLVLDADKFLIAGQENTVSNNISREYAIIFDASSTAFNAYRLRANGVVLEGSTMAISDLGSGKYFAVIKSKDASNHSILVEFQLPTSVGQEYIDVNWKRDHDDSKLEFVNKLYTDNTNRNYWAGSINGSNIRTQLTGGYTGEVPDIGGEFPNNLQNEMEVKDFFSPANNVFLFAGTSTAGEEKDIRIEYVIKEGLNFTPLLSDNQAFVFAGTDIPASINLANDGDIIVLATTDNTSANGEEDFALLKIHLEYLASEGKYVMSTSFPEGIKYYGGAASETAVAVLPDPTGGIVMFGYTEFADVNTLLIMKVNDNGDFE